MPRSWDEHSAVIDALQCEGGASRGKAQDKVPGGRDSACGNMIASIYSGRRGSILAGQMLYYPEARLPFNTPAATENNTGYCLECDGIFFFPDYYLKRGVPPGHPYIPTGMQRVGYLKDPPLARVYTSGFDPLRDVGVEYAHKLQPAGNDVKWRLYADMTHG